MSKSSTGKQKINETSRKSFHFRGSIKNLLYYEKQSIYIHIFLSCPFCILCYVYIFHELSICCMCNNRLIIFCFFLPLFYRDTIYICFSIILCLLCFYFQYCQYTRGLVHHNNSRLMSLHFHSHGNVQNEAQNGCERNNILGMNKKRAWRGFAWASFVDPQLSIFEFIEYLIFKLNIYLVIH